MDKKQVGAWALFDFANSVYPAVITSTLFALFYADVVVGNESGRGDWWWGRAVSISALVVAASAPLLGAIADRGGGRKKFMLFYVGLCLVGVVMMSTLQAGMVVQGFIIFVVANVGFESVLVFYNAYLPDIAPPRSRGGCPVSVSASATSALRSDSSWYFPSPETNGGSWYGSW